MQSIYWHDYETFGADPQKDRPAQFAGIRTDLDLNIIGEPLTIYCKPPEDSLPSPEACLITGITPQLANDKGLREAEFAKCIHSVFSVPGTCVAGYNSIRFDDEVSRNLFYRNFYDPYEREWKNGNSRWDIIDVVRLAYALRPEGIHWPIGDDGQPTFRLEKLCEANNIEHEAAHDAMSDVYATISLAKLIKSKQPQLYHYVFAHRDKRSLVDLIELDNLKPLFHVSSKYPASLGCCALVLPLFQHPVNKNGYVAFDLRQDPQLLLDLSREEIEARLYTKTQDLKDGEVRPALKTIHVNKCPMLVPAAMIKTISQLNLQSWQLDIGLMQSRLQWFREHPELISKLKGVFEDAHKPDSGSDPDLMIYSGGFFSPADKATMAQIQKCSESELAEGEFLFQDKRLPEMMFRYKARNYPAILTEQEQERWQQHCANRLLAKDSNYLNFEQLFSRLSELSIKSAQSDRDRSILEDLKYYAESIIPYS